MAKSTTALAHVCQMGEVRVGDTFVRGDGTRSEVSDVQHYRVAHIGWTAEIRGAGGFRVNGAPIAAPATVVAGPNHPTHD